MYSIYILINHSFQKSTEDKIQITLKEGDINGKILRCKLTIPITCSNGLTSCDLQVWLNYKDFNSYNRIVIKECNKNSNGDFNCNGCNQKFFRNSTISTENSEIFWNLVSNMESTNLNRNYETYDIDLLSNKNSTSLGSLWTSLKLPSLKVLRYNFKQRVYLKLKFNYKF